MLYKRKKIAVVLVCSMLLQILPLPVGVFSGFPAWVSRLVTRSEAAEFSGAYQGTSWVLTPNGNTDEEGDALYDLRLSGNGEMPSFMVNAIIFRSGLKNLKNIVEKVFIEDGITYVDTFQNFAALDTVELADSVTGIEGYGFRNCPFLESIELPDNLNYLVRVLLKVLKLQL